MMSSQEQRLCIEQAKRGPRVYMWELIVQAPGSLLGTVAWMRTEWFTSLAQALTEYPHLTLHMGTPVPTERTVIDELESP